MQPRVKSVLSIWQAVESINRGGWRRHFKENSLNLRHANACTPLSNLSLQQARREIRRARGYSAASL